MPDQNSGQQSQADSGQQSQADNQQSANSQADSGQQSQEKDTLETVQAKLAKSVQAEKNLRERLKAAEAAEAELKKLKDAELSEVERLKTQLAEKEKAAANAAAESRKLKTQVLAQANGYRPDAAALWLSQQQIADDSDDAILTALKSAPDWVKATSPGITTPPNNPGRQGQTLTKEQLKNMSTQEIMKLDPKLVDAALAVG